MITVYFTNGTKMEFSMATQVRASGFLDTDEPGVRFIDARGNVLAEFKVKEISGYIDEVDVTRRQAEMGKGGMPQP